MQAGRARGALLSALVVHVAYVGCSHSLIYKGCTASVGTRIHLIIIIIIILSFDIAPFPYKHAQRSITFHCQRIDVDIHIVN